MGLPNINILFATKAATAITRSQKGVVSIILRDENAKGAHVLTSNLQIPSELSKENKDYVDRTFLGYITPPRKVLLFVTGLEDELNAALAYFETQKFDYLVGPHDITTAECQTIATWIKTQNINGNMFKAVLPKTASDSELIINFATDNNKFGEDTFTAEEYCSRIAGLIAGTPMTISCTYAPLAELTDVDRLNKSDMDGAIDAGKFILMHDGEKVKVGRGINSLVTTTESKGKAYKKIKIVEAIHMITNDIKKTMQDSYIGKYSNSYDNKCLLISAIKGYFLGLEQEGILAAGTSAIGIDMVAQENYLISKGINTEDMSEDDVKNANTDDQVFLTASLIILDAIEDIDLNITI